MKALILAGGLGTRLREETEFKPKPMVEVGGHPVLWHIMKNFAKFGHTDFVIATGYKSEIIKDYFLNYKAPTAIHLRTCLRPLRQYHSGSSDQINPIPLRVCPRPQQHHHSSFLNQIVPIPPCVCLGPLLQHHSSFLNSKNISPPCAYKRPLLLIHLIFTTH